MAVTTLKLPDLFGPEVLRSASTIYFVGDQHLEGLAVYFSRDGTDLALVAPSSAPSHTSFAFPALSPDRLAGLTYRVRVVNPNTFPVWLRWRVQGAEKRNPAVLQDLTPLASLGAFAAEALRQQAWPRDAVWLAIEGTGPLSGHVALETNRGIAIIELPFQPGFELVEWEETGSLAAFNLGGGWQFWELNPKYRRYEVLPHDPQPTVAISTAIAQPTSQSSTPAHLAVSPFLRSPLPYGPYAAPISSAFDHSIAGTVVAEIPRSSEYKKDQVVHAFTGERGTVAPISDCYRQPSGAAFQLAPAYYTGISSLGNTYLCYDGHPGYDYRVPSGTDVYAAAQGVVIEAQCHGYDASGNCSIGLGYYVKIDHGNNFHTLYGHLSQLLVEVNQVVSQGQPIGKSGSSGNSTGPHLHFQVRRLTGSGQLSVDPYGWDGADVLWISGSCNYSINPTSSAFNASGGSGSVSVSAPSGCPWTAGSSASWISITSGSSGNGNGTVSYTVAANSSTSSRTGTMTIAGQTFTVTQAGISCTYSISPTSASYGASGGSGSVSVSAPGGCPWTASSNASWISITSGSSGSGNGTVSYTVATNSSTTSRTGILTIASNTFTVNQLGASCSYSINPSSASFGPAGGTGTFNVFAPPGCSWSASTAASWITITSGSGSGNGTVSFSVAANTSTSPRTTSISVQGQVFAIAQSGGTGCTYSIPASTVEFGPYGGQGTIMVEAASGCPWTANTNVSWITITGGQSGIGRGPVSFRVDSNPTGSARTGFITVEGQVCRVDQLGSCTYTITPSAATFGASGGTGSINVTAPSVCYWSATSEASWITLSSPQSGLGNGSVSYTVAPNSSTASRSGTIRIQDKVFVVTQAGASPVSNDEPAWAVTITDLPYSVTEDTATATTSAADPVHSCTGTQDSNTVWFRWTANFTGRLRADTFGSNYDTVLAAYSGASAPGMELACNDNSGGALQSRIEFPVGLGQTYWIQVSDYGGPGGGTLVLNLRGVAPGDYNKDGRQDLLWRNDSTRQVTVHYFRGIGFVNWAWLHNSGIGGWRVVTGSDFDGNGTPDLVWQNDSTRQVTVHYFDGASFIGWNWLNAGSNPGWWVVAAADVNGDGKPDLIWQNETSRAVTVHYYGGTQGNQFTGWAWLSSGFAGWRVVAAADFNGDGRADLVWQNDSTRQVTVHYYSGSNWLGWNWLNAATQSGWAVVGAGDYNGDGKPDLVWQNDNTRQVTVHYYSGASGNQFTGWAWLNDGGIPGWRAVVPR